MNSREDQKCLECGSSLDSIKYHLPPHSQKSKTRLCRICGSIIGPDDIRGTDSSDRRKTP